jgi:glutamate/aspartate transport system substrate-binding protein
VRSHGIQVQGKAVMSNLRKAVAVILPAILAGLHAASADTLQRIKDSGAITIGYRENSIPMSYADAHQPMGFALDLCAGVVSKVKQKLGLPGLKIDYQAVTQARAAQLLATGAMALDCAATPVSADLAGQTAFSEPVFVSELRWIAPRRLRVEREGRHGTRYETISPASAGDLKGKPVVLTQGAGFTSLVLGLSSERSLGLSILEAKDDAESFKLVETGKASAFLGDEVLLVSLKANAKNPDGFGFLNDAYPGMPYALMLGKEDSQFKELVDSAIAGAMQSGEYAKLYAKWFESPIPPKNVNLDYPMPGKLMELVKAAAGKAGTQ